MRIGVEGRSLPSWDGLDLYPFGATPGRDLFEPLRPLIIM
jgi:hypothetical protein